VAACAGSSTRGICLYVAVSVPDVRDRGLYHLDRIDGAHTLGFHKRVVCPSCGYRFTHGIPVDETGTTADTTDDASHEGPGEVRCPNWRRRPDRHPAVPPNHGRPVAGSKESVRVSPAAPVGSCGAQKSSRPTPFVKRVGLAAETNRSKSRTETSTSTAKSVGRIWLIRRALRIRCTTTMIRPTILRTVRPTGWLRIRKAAGGPRARGSLFSPAARPRRPPADSRREVGAHADEQMAWVAFRHRVRRGGRFTRKYRSPIQTGRQPAQECLSASPLRPGGTQLEANGGRRSHSPRSTLGHEFAARTRGAAIEELFVQSHSAPVTDDYGLQPARTRDWFRCRCGPNLSNATRRAGAPGTVPSHSRSATAD